MFIRDRACIGPKAKGVEELGAASGLPTGLLLGTLMTVSYTHLDVYKRQRPACVP